MKKKYFLSLFIIILFTLTSQAVRSQIFWEERNSGVTVSLNSVSNIDASKAWICGDSGTVLRTSNGGYNWYNVSGNGIPSNVTLVNIFGVNASTALVAGFKDSNTFVYRSTNSGANWSQVFFQMNGFVNAVWMNTDSTGILQGNPVGGRWSLWRTSNGGANWDSVGLFLTQTNTEIGCRNSLWLVNNKIWFGTNNSRIYYSDSSGLQWISQSTSPEIYSYSIWMDFTPSLLGFIAGSSLYKTTNGGLNWSIMTTPGVGNFNTVTGKTQYFNYFFYIRTSSNIYISWSGTSWNLQYTAPNGIYNHIAISRSSIMLGPGAGFAVRNNGGISRGNFVVEGVKIISNEIPSAYKLYQNFPNPFNSTTKIKFESRLLSSSIPGEVRGGIIHLVIYDIQGKEVATLINKVIQPGIYEASWQAGNLTSGVYFCRMIVSDPNGNQVVHDQILKMILLK
jgi:photosystem II stability/assembly factor-like uncharacterized protein